MSMQFWNNFWTVLAGLIGFIPATIALLFSNKALKQNREQLEIGNKQFLFDRRMKIYNILTNLYPTFEKYKDFKKKSGEINKTNAEKHIHTLINNNFFNFGGILLETNKKKNENLFLKINELSSLCLQMDFIFNEEDSEIIHGFFMNYNYYLGDLIIIKNRLEEKKVANDLRVASSEDLNELKKESEKHYEKLNYFFEAISNDAFMNGVRKKIVITH